MNVLATREPDPRPHRLPRVISRRLVPADMPHIITAGTMRRMRHRGVAGLIALDALMVSLAMIAAVLIRQAALGRAGDLAGAVADASVLIGVGWLAAIALFGGYATRLFASGTQMFRNLMRASAVAAGVVGVGVYLTGIELSRAFFVALFAIGPVLLMAGRYAARKVLGQLRRRGRLRVGVVAVGPLSHVDHITRIFRRESWLGYEMIGAVSPVGDPRLESELGVPVLGHEGDVESILATADPSVLLFTVGATGTAEEFRRTGWALEDSNIDVIVAPAMTEIASDRVELRPVAGLPLVHMERPRARDSLRWTKRAFDVVAAGLGLLLISPVLAAIALVIKLHDGGPVLFTQERVGRNGEVFSFLKFRSMVTNAEEVLAEIRERETQDKGNAVMFKMKDDPRITTPGRFLRRYSCDELPQLINVLKGDMSLVGPRPALVHEVSAYDEDARRRLSVRPGITGLWQVSGRSELSWEETVRLDLYYVDNWSFLQDLQILVRTVKAVLASDGAY